MPVATLLSVLFSILVPQKMWFGANQPVMVTVQSEGQVTLVLTEFDGRVLDAKAANTAQPGDQVDLRKIYPIIATPGTYVLYAVPKEKDLTQFAGTPLVIISRGDPRQGAPADANVIKVEPLRHAVLSAEQGDITIVFYYDVAPNTVETFLRLSEQGFYDGLTFHRIVPGFVIQGGDPRGNGTGGPGFTQNAEFSQRKHEEGVLSMARSGGKGEAHGEMPRPEFANSAGSQFFICLGKATNLDGRYTAFGQVASGMDAVKAIAAVSVADRETGRPQDPPVIKRITVKPVTAADNPYAKMMQLEQNK